MAAIEQALQLPAGDLRLEIAVVRAVIAELLAGDVAAPELVNGLVKATGALTRMLRAQRLMEPSQGDEADAVLPLVLRDLGLGERNE